jgi:hypothetical protein
MEYLKILKVAENVRAKSIINILEKTEDGSG